MQHFLVILYLPKAFYNDEFVCYNIGRTVHLLNHPKAQTVNLGGGGDWPRETPPPPPPPLGALPNAVLSDLSGRLDPIVLEKLWYYP